MMMTFDAHTPATAFAHDSTLVVALELSGKSWEVGAVVPGLSRQPRRRVAVGDIAAVRHAVERWTVEARGAGRTVGRVVLTYEAGRDGFWIARALGEAGFEVHVMHPASVPVERRGRRAKTDRIDLDMLLRTFLAWLRGEPRVCTMVAIPSEAEEDARRPGREREALTRDRIAVGNRIANLLALHGITGFKPRLKKAAARLEGLRARSGAALPARAMAELRRLMQRHDLLSAQLAELAAAQESAAMAPRPDRETQQVQLLRQIVGCGLDTAATLVYEVFCRRFRNRRALGAFPGLAGTPFNSGKSTREQGIGKNGNARVRRILMQLAWRWLRFQPESALTRWFLARTGGAKGRIRKIMAVALARKLLIALWRYVTDGVVPEGARLAAA